MKKLWSGPLFSKLAFLSLSCLLLLNFGFADAFDWNLASSLSSVQKQVRTTAEDEGAEEVYQQPGFDWVGLGRLVEAFMNNPRKLLLSFAQENIERKLNEENKKRELRENQRNSINVLSARPSSKEKSETTKDMNQKNHLEKRSLEDSEENVKKGVCTGKEVIKIVTTNICSPGCRLFMIDCDGVQKTLNFFTGNLSTCTASRIFCPIRIPDFPRGCNISSLLYHNSLVPATTEVIKNGGLLGELICGNTSLDFSNFKNTPKCVISNLKCGSSQITSFPHRGGKECILEHRDCKSNEACQLLKAEHCQNDICVFNKYECHDPCVFSESIKECHCGVDTVPPRCSPRQFMCNFSLVEPQRPQSCLRHKSANRITADDSDGDPSCFTRKRNDTIILNYIAGCEWSSRLDLPAMNNDSYWAKGDKFAQSNSDGWVAMLKVFNFNKLSDTSSVWYVSMTADMVAGKEKIPFALDLSKVGNSHIAGGRIYLEVGIKPNNPPQGFVGVYRRDRLFIDISDAPRKKQKTSSFPIWKILLIVTVAITVLSVLGYAVYRLKRRMDARRSKKKHY